MVAASQLPRHSRIPLRRDTTWPRSTGANSCERQPRPPRFLSRAASPGRSPFDRRTPPASPIASAGLVVNDVHSQLNATTVSEIVKPADRRRRAGCGGASAIVRDLGGGRRREARDGRPAVRRGRHAGRYARPQSRARVRRRAGDHHGRGRHPVAAAARASQPCPGGRRAAVGDLSEADRRRPSEHRRGAVLQCARARAEPEADRSAGRGVRSGGRRRRGPTLLAHQRIPSCSGWPSAATGCSASSRACA